MRNEMPISDEDFNHIRGFIARAVMAGVTGREVSNAIISSDGVGEFEARIASHVMVCAQRGKK